ncbi:MAG: hypothetical protein EOO38_10530 [Cytophagaceae bacterium]|nr:MAG: hypothetical protein EOO38_10530 [Cytophagaceae bacterium]
MRGETLGRLRAETRAEHERLEAKVDIPSRMITKDAYASLVARFYGIIDQSVCLSGPAWHNVY